MNPVQRVSELLTRCGGSDAILPATELYNEGWMLRLVLDWASAHPAAIEELRFDEGSRWFSEALLASRFRPRSRGDRSGEGFTHADGVIGHFRLRPGGRGDIELLPAARQLTVIEAKMASGLSRGTRHARDFNQAARNVACIAHLLSEGDCGAAVTNCGFVLIAPRARIDQGIFGAVEPTEIKAAVERRAQSFDAAATAWCEGVFVDVLSRCKLQIVAWETVLDRIGDRDATSALKLREFYSACLLHNPLPTRR